MEYRTRHNGERCRVHREYVDVLVRFGRAGDVEPVAVMWRDGRTFPVDEVLEKGEFGGKSRGCQTAVYRIRFGDHETEIYLERRDAEPESSRPELFRWWVYAYDAVKPGSRDAADREAADRGTC